MGNDSKVQSSVEGSLPVVKLFPNIVTMLGLCFGLTSIKCTFAGQWEPAVTFVMLAMVIDGIDGKIARLFNASSSFGSQLDSLADFLSFGVAPAFLLYSWSLYQIRAVGWILAMVFVLCMSFRLARFNVSVCAEDAEDWRRFFFVGVPAPLCALLALVPVMLTFHDSDLWWLSEKVLNKEVVAAYLALVSFLSVSRVPTISTKYHGIPKKWFYPFVTMLGIVMVLAVTNPWVTFPVTGLCYFISIPMVGWYYAYVSAKFAQLQLRTECPLSRNGWGTEDNEDSDD